MAPKWRGQGVAEAVGRLTISEKLYWRGSENVNFAGGR